MPLGNFHLKCYQTFCTNLCNVFMQHIERTVPYVNGNTLLKENKGEYFVEKLEIFEEN